MTRRKKITIKQAEKFSKDVQEFLNSIGAKESEDPLGYGTHLETTLGTLRIIVPNAESNSRSEIATIFARFEEPKRAAKGLGINSCNPHSGKWNFHEYSTEECLRVFMANVNRILLPVSEKMSGRKFYKTTIEVVVLSEEPLPYLSLAELGREVEIGELVGHQESRKQLVLNGKEMAEALEDAASDPEFFNLTPEGEDLDEDLTEEELAALNEEVSNA